MIPVRLRKISVTVKQVQERLMNPFEYLLKLFYLTSKEHQYRRMSYRAPLTTLSNCMQIRKHRCEEVVNRIAVACLVLWASHYHGGFVNSNGKHRFISITDEVSVVHSACGCAGAEKSRQVQTDD